MLISFLYSSSSNNNNKTTSITNVTTTCFLYEGKECRAAFSTTLQSLRLIPRFHRTEKNSVESYLAASITAINETVKQSECKAALTAMLCHHTIPPCLANNTMTRFCMSDCKEFFFKCRHFIDQLEVAMNLIPGGKDFRLSFPDCFGLRNSSELDEADEPCMKLGLSKYPMLSYFVFMVLRHNCVMIYPYNQLPSKPTDCDLHDIQCCARVAQHDEPINLATHTHRK